MCLSCCGSSWMNLNNTSNNGKLRETHVPLSLAPCLCTDLSVLGGLPFPRDLPDPGLESRSSAWQADSLPAEPPGSPSSSQPSHWVILLISQMWKPRQSASEVHGPQAARAVTGGAGVTSLPLAALLGVGRGCDDLTSYTCLGGTAEFDPCGERRLLVGAQGSALGLGARSEERSWSLGLPAPAAAAGEPADPRPWDAPDPGWHTGTPRKWIAFLPVLQT